jgi:hypothetical protein
MKLLYRVTFLTRIALILLLCSALNKVFSNRQQAGIMGASTGTWLTPLDGQDISLTNVGNDRPNVVGNSHLSRSLCCLMFVA